MSYLALDTPPPFSVFLIGLTPLCQNNNNRRCCFRNFWNCTVVLARGESNTQLLRGVPPPVSSKLCFVSATLPVMAVFWGGGHQFGTELMVTLQSSCCFFFLQCNSNQFLFVDRKFEDMLGCSCR